MEYKNRINIQNLLSYVCLVNSLHCLNYNYLTFNFGTIIWPMYFRHNVYYCKHFMPYVIHIFMCLTLQLKSARTPVDISRMPCC